MNMSAQPTPLLDTTRSGGNTSCMLLGGGGGARYLVRGGRQAEHVALLLPQPGSAVTEGRHLVHAPRAAQDKTPRTPPSRLTVTTHDTNESLLRRLCTPNLASRTVQGGPPRILDRDVTVSTTPPRTAAWPPSNTAQRGGHAHAQLTHNGRQHVAAPTRQHRPEAYAGHAAPGLLHGGPQAGVAVHQGPDEVSQLGGQGPGQARDLGTRTPGETA
jgi:hypothetical protein